MFQCRLDSTDAGDFVPCSSPHVVTGLSVGTHTFDVRAVDFSGNIDQTPATHTWTIDAPAPGVPPDTTIDSGPDATTVATSATFTFSANEPGVTFECCLDGGCLRAVHVATGVHRTRRRRPHVRGPRHRRRDPHRPDAGDLRVDHLRATSSRRRELRPGDHDQHAW